MQENIGWPPSDLTINGKKRYLKKSLKFNGIDEMCT
jgi:hypothetical protein